jgi:hypothetical protein
LADISRVDRNTPYESLPQYLTVDEVGAWLGLSRTTSYDLGRKIGVRFGRLIRVPRESLKPTTLIDSDLVGREHGLSHIEEVQHG